MGKAQSIMTDKMVMIIFALLVFVVLVFLLDQVGGGIRGIIEQFCKSYPNLCGLKSQPAYYDEIALRSTEALQCAINSVTEGKEQACATKFRPVRTLSVVSAQENYDYNTSPIIKCNDDVSSCEINNFNLPQDISSAQEWIKGYGDPEYLVYWQAFPVGEDSAWNSEWNWAENAWDISLAFWGGGKIFQVAKAAGGRLLSVPIRAGKGAIEKVIGTGAFREGAEEAGQDIIKRVGKSKLERLGIATTAGTLVTAAYLDSITEKMNPRPNNLLLKSPYEDPAIFSLLFENKPVMLENREIGFYAASPCSANLKVEKKIAHCKNYYWDYKENVLKCEDPDIQKFGQINEGERCENTRDVTMFFKDKDRFVPARITELNNKQAEVMVTEMPARLIVREPITKFSFEYEDIEKDGVVTKKMKSIVFESSEGIKSFPLDGADKYEDEKVSINLKSDRLCKIYTDLPFGSLYDCEVKFSVEVRDVSCIYCNEVKAMADKLDEITFSVNKDLLEGESEKLTEYRELTVFFIGESGIFFDEGYKVVMRDMPKYSEDGITYSFDGIADTIGLDYLGSVKYTIWYHTFPDKVVLKDINFDGTFDVINEEDCKVEVMGVSADRAETGERNFCHREKHSTVHYVLEWAPAVGTVIGGAAGFLGGPFAEITVPAGAATGTKVGAVVFGVYRIWTGVRGTPAIWPGIE